MSQIVFPMVTETESRLPFLLVGIGCQHEQEHIVRPHGYPLFQWIQCHHGKGAVILGGVEYSVQENQGMLLYPHEPHEYYAVADHWQVDWVSFGGYQTGEFFKRMGMHTSKVYYISQPGLLLSKVRAVYSMAQSGETFRNHDCSVLLYDMLINFAKYASEEEVNPVHQKQSRLKPVLDYIDQNYQKPFTLDELADVIGVSPQYLCTLFKNTCKTRVLEYVNNVRILKSKELILTCDDKHIREIAKRCGFEDFSYFCAVFKRFEKISPGEFKQLHGK